MLNVWLKKQKILFIITLLLGFINFNSVKVFAADPSTGPISCSGPAIATYIDGVMNNVDRGVKGQSNIFFTSPVFNSTSPFPSQFLAQFKTASNWSSLDVIAANSYVTSDGTGIIQHLENAGIMREGKPIILTEVGHAGFAQSGGDRGAAMARLKTDIGAVKAESKIRYASFFNAFGNNGDPRWAPYVMSDGEINDVCGGSCGKVGINTATYYPGDEATYSRAVGLGMNNIVSITNVDTESGKKAIDNAVRVGLRSIVFRVGVGNDDGGFMPPSAYASYINAMAPYVAGKDIEVYFIIGPNEPETECWAAPMCVPAGQEACGDSEELPDVPIRIKGHIFSAEDKADYVNGVVVRAYSGTNITDANVQGLASGKDSDGNISDFGGGNDSDTGLNHPGFKPRCSVSGRSELQLRKDAAGNLIEDVEELSANLKESLLECEQTPQHKDINLPNKGSINNPSASAVICDDYGGDDDDVTRKDCEGYYELTTWISNHNYNQTNNYLAFFCNGELKDLLKIFLPGKTSGVTEIEIDNYIKCSHPRNNTLPMLVEPPTSLNFVSRGYGLCEDELPVAETLPKEPVESQHAFSLFQAQADGGYTGKSLLTIIIDILGGRDKPQGPATSLEDRAVKRRSTNISNTAAVLQQAVGSPLNSLTLAKQTNADQKYLPSCYQLYASGKVKADPEFSGFNAVLNQGYLSKLSTSVQLHNRYLALKDEQAEWEVCTIDEATVDYLQKLNERRAQTQASGINYVCSAGSVAKFKQFIPKLGKAQFTQDGCFLPPEFFPSHLLVGGDDKKVTSQDITCIDNDSHWACNNEVFRDTPFDPTTTEPDAAKVGSEKVETTRYSGIKQFGFGIASENKLAKLTGEALDPNDPKSKAFEGMTNFYLNKANILEMKKDPGARFSKAVKANINPVRIERLGLQQELCTTNKAAGVSGEENRNNAAVTETHQGALGIKFLAKEPADATDSAECTEFMKRNTPGLCTPGIYLGLQSYFSWFAETASQALANLVTGGTSQCAEPTYEDVGSTCVGDSNICRVKTCRLDDREDGEPCNGNEDYDANPLEFCRNSSDEYLAYCTYEKRSADNGLYTCSGDLEKRGVIARTDSIEYRSKIPAGHETLNAMFRGKLDAGQAPLAGTTQSLAARSEKNKDGHNYDNIQGDTSSFLTNTYLKLHFSNGAKDLTFPLPTSHIVGGGPGSKGGAICNAFNCFGDNVTDFESSLQCALNTLKSYKNLPTDKLVDNYGPYCHNETFQQGSPFAHNLFSFIDAYAPQSSGRSPKTFIPNDLREPGDKDMACRPSNDPTRNVPDERYVYYRGPLKEGYSLPGGGVGSGLETHSWHSSLTVDGVIDDVKEACYLGSCLNRQPDADNFLSEQLRLVVQGAKDEGLNPYLVLGIWATESGFSNRPSCRGEATTGGGAN